MSNNDFDMNKTDRVVSDAIREGGKAVSNEIRLSTGVVLRGRPANPNILLRVVTKMPRPEPPVWIHPTMGREMQNPDDPDYIKRVDAWDKESAAAVTLALIILGTEILSVPEGMEGPYDKDAKWIQSYRMIGLPIFPDNPDWRYQTWVMYKAAPLPEDTKMIMEVVGKLSGIKGADVRNVDNFPESDKTDRVQPA